MMCEGPEAEFIDIHLQHRAQITGGCCAVHLGVLDFVGFEEAEILIKLGFLSC